MTGQITTVKQQCGTIKPSLQLYAGALVYERWEVIPSSNNGIEKCLVALVSLTLPRLDTVG